MDPRQRRVLMRIFIFLLLFIYIGYFSYKMLPRFDFEVIMLFFGIFLTWTLLSETMLYQAPDTYVIDDDDRKTFLYMQLSFFIGLLYSAVDFVELHYTRMFHLEPWIVIAGFIIFLISCPIRWMAIKQIGKYFNHRVAFYEGHRLVTGGIYNKIRHPIYLGNLLSSLATALIFSSWGGLLIILFAMVPSIVYRIKVEEEFLLRHFGAEYRQYMDRTGRMIPGV